MNRAIIGLALASLSLPGVSLGQSAETLLVGESGLTAANLNALLRGVGTLTAIDGKGFYRVRPNSGLSVEDLRLKLSSIDFVLPGSADRVNRSNLGSVRDHLRYLDGSFQIVRGRLPRTGESPGGDDLRAQEYYLSTRVDPERGVFDPLALKSAIRHRDLMPAARKAMLDPGQMQSLAPIVWSQVGPSKLFGTGQPGFGSGPLSGRKNGMAVSPSNPNVIYVASAGGGVWKSIDGGATFTSVSNGWTFLNTSCVAIDPTNPNIVYAGIGDPHGILANQTLGIMKSTNGGASWTLKGSAEFGDSTPTRILINPANPSVLLALVSGPSGDIWRSTDSGETWARTNASNGNWQDIDQGAAGRLVAVGAGNGIATSSDFGATWLPIAPPLLVGGSLWDVAVSKLDPGRWYLITSNHHIYRTATLGVIWVDITLDHDLGCNDPFTNWSDASQGLSVECGSNGILDLVFTGLETISASGIDGVLWADISDSNDANPKLPASQRFMALHPTDPNKLIVCGTGGAGIFDFGAPGGGQFTSMNGSICDVMFNGVAVNPANRTYLVGGAYDVGSPACLGTPYDQPWRSLFGTSGGGTAYDKTNPHIHYTSGAGGQVYRYTTDNDLNPDDISPGGGSAVSPLVCAGPGGSLPVFGASNGNVRVFNGATWSNNPTGGSAVRTIAVSKWDTNRIYTGAQNGDVYRAPTVNGPFTKIDANLPDRPIGGIAESPYTPDLLLVALQGTGNNDGVWRCNDATAAAPVWVNISGAGNTALPNTGVNDVEFDPYTNVYYAATDIGVFMSPDGGVRWYNLSALGLPNVPVSDLYVSSVGGANYLYAATIGRGVWRCLLSSRYLTSILVFKPEIYGGMQNTITLKLNGSAPVGAITLLTDGTSNVSVPNTVTFPVGSTQVTFPAFTVDPPATETVTLTGKVFQTTATASFVLHKVPNFTYTPDSAAVYGGERFTATIDLHEPAPIVTVLTFSDTSPNVASPASTSISAGGQLRTVALHTLPVPNTESVTIRAKIANTVKTSNLTVYPRPDITSFTVNPTSVTGGTPVTGTINLNFPGGGGPLKVRMSDTSTIVTTPSILTIPGGVSTHNFGIPTAAVHATFTVTLRARLGDVEKTTTLIVHP